jgi:CRP-like cAMP-binding protein
MDTEKRVGLLRSLALFASLPEPRLVALSALLEPLSFEGGAVIIVEGARSDGLYYVVTGGVRIAKRLGEGGEKDLAFLGPGEGLGEMELLHEGVRSASGYAVGPTEVLRLKSADLRSWLDSDPPTSARFYARLAEIQSGRLRRTSDEVAMLYDFSQLLVMPQATPSGLLTHALHRVTPHLQGRWSAEARIYNFFDNELNLVSRIGAGQTPDEPEPAVSSAPDSAWLDGRTLRLVLRSPKALLASLRFRAEEDLDDAKRAEAERTLAAVARLLSSALENVEHRTDEALRDRLRAQNYGTSI